MSWRRQATAAGLVAFSAVSALGMTFRGQIEFSSDEGIIALMALDILKKGAHPVFCYGSQYSGTLEAHYLAMVFGALGPTVAAFQFGLWLVVAATILVVWKYTERSFGRDAGLAAGIYLAAGPGYFFFKGLTSDGAYATLLLLLALSLGMVLRIGREIEAGRGALSETCLLGLLLGAAWWVHPLVVCIGPVLASAALRGRTREWLRARRLALLTVTFLAGGLPWWVKNLRTGFASLRVNEMAATGKGRLGTQAAALLTDGIPVLFGGRPAWFESFYPGSCLLSIALSSALVSAGVVAWLRWERREESVTAMLLLALIASTIVLSLLVGRSSFVEPRYLLPVYLGVAPLAGYAFASLLPAGIPRWGIAALVLVLNIASQCLWPRLVGRELRDFEFSTPALIRGLEERGVNTVYANYWAAYRLTFLSGRAIIATPFGRYGMTRSVEDRRLVDATADPTFLLEGMESIGFEAWLKSEGIPHWREELEGFTLFRGLPADRLMVLRTCNCVPSVLRPGAVEWIGVEGPASAEAGGILRYRVSFRNVALRYPSENVHFGVRWWSADGLHVISEGVRALLPRYPAVGEKISAEADVPVDVPPGRYRLCFDLVDSNVAWLAGRGTPPLFREIVVNPSTRAVPRAPQR